MRKHLIALLFLPIAVFLWIIGWAMVWIGSHKRQKAQQTQVEKASEDEFITVGAIIPEKPEENEA
jgi:undecaprenyl pyrophosphate phosphatase UppP